MPVLFARDAGAANQVVAIVDLLAGRLDCPPILDLLAKFEGAGPATSIIWGLGPALKVYASAGLRAQEQNPEDVSAAATLLKEAGARLLVTGTGDVDDRATPLLWIAASRQRIPSIALLDSVENMQSRFDIARGERPDWIVAADRRAVARLQEIGVAASDIIVLVENLHHVRLATLPRSDRQAMRLAWRVSADARVVLFVSENAAEARAMGRNVDFDEFSLLASLIADVGLRRPVGPLKCDHEQPVVVIRPHSRDLPGKYNRYARARDPQVIICAAGTPAEAIAGADLVVGMRSALLDEARILGRPIHHLI